MVFVYQGSLIWYILQMTDEVISLKIQLTAI
jgi:hypothetical protein